MELSEYLRLVVSACAAYPRRLLEVEVGVHVVEGKVYVVPDSSNRLRLVIDDLGEFDGLGVLAANETVAGWPFLPNKEGKA